MLRMNTASCVSSPSTQQHSAFHVGKVPLWKYSLTVYLLHNTSVLQAQGWDNKTFAEPTQPTQFLGKERLHQGRRHRAQGWGQFRGTKRAWHSECPRMQPLLSSQADSFQMNVSAEALLPDRNTCLEH